MLSGPDKGRVTEVGSPEVAHETLAGLAVRGREWKLDLSKATPEEIFLWKGADLHARIYGAVSHKRPVVFEGVRYVPSLQLFGAALVGHIEKAIADRGCAVRIASDNQEGLVVKVLPLKPLPVLVGGASA